MTPSKIPVYYTGGVPVKIIRGWKTRPVVFEKPVRYSEFEWANASKLANDTMDSDEQICNWMCKPEEINRKPNSPDKEAKVSVASASFLELANVFNQIKANQMKPSSSVILDRLDTWKKGVKRRLRQVDEEKDEILSVFRDIKEEIDSLTIYENRVENCNKSLCLNRLDINNTSLGIIKSYNFKADLSTKKIEKQIASENRKISEIQQQLEKLLKGCKKLDNMNRGFYYNLGKELQSVNAFKTQFVQKQTTDWRPWRCHSIHSKAKLKLGDKAEKTKLHAIKAITATVELKVKIDEYLIDTGKTMKTSTEKTDEMIVEHYKKFVTAVAKWMELKKSLSATVKKVEAKICILEKGLRERNVALKLSEEKFKKQNIQQMQGDTIHNCINDVLEENKQSVKTTELEIANTENTLRVLLRHLFRIKESYKDKPWDQTSNENGYPYVACKLRPAWRMTEY